MDKSRRRIKDFIDSANQLMPIAGLSRQKSIQALLMKLNRDLKDMGAFGGTNIYWGEATVCPMDAISLFVKGSGDTANKEITVAAVEWGNYTVEKQPCIVKVTALSPFENKHIDDIILCKKGE